MTRGELRAAVAGFLLALTVCVGAFALNDAQVNAEIAAADRHSDSLTVALMQAKRAERAALEEQKKADARADVASAKAEAIAHRMGQYKPLRVGMVDSSGYATVTRNGVEWKAPAWLIEERTRAVKDLWTMKYAWEAERAARKLAVDVTIPRVVLRSDVGDKLAESLRKGIQLRDARANPWCGWKCGAALGSGVVVLLAIVAK